MMTAAELNRLRDQASQAEAPAPDATKTYDEYRAQREANQPPSPNCEPEKETTRRPPQTGADRLRRAAAESRDSSQKLRDVSRAMARQSQELEDLLRVLPADLRSVSPGADNCLNRLASFLLQEPPQNT